MNDFEIDAMVRENSVLRSNVTMLEAQLKDARLKQEMAEFSQKEAKKSSDAFLSRANSLLLQMCVETGRIEAAQCSSWNDIRATITYLETVPKSASSLATAPTTPPPPAQATSVLFAADPSGLGPEIIAYAKEHGLTYEQARETAEAAKAAGMDPTKTATQVTQFKRAGGWS